MAKNDTTETKTRPLWTRTVQRQIVAPQSVRELRYGLGYEGVNGSKKGQWFMTVSYVFGKPQPGQPPPRLAVKVALPPDQAAAIEAILQKEFDAHADELQAQFSAQQ